MPTLDQLEASIGLRSNSGRKTDEEALAARLLNLESMLKANLDAWLVKQGLPDKNVKGALSSSKVKAYVNANYLRGWRNKVNPSWALLSGEDDADAMDEYNRKDTEATSSAPKAEAITSPMNTVQSEAWLKALYEQINKSVNVLTNSLVEAKLASTTLKLDQTAKDQIKALARDSAQQRIDELAKPQVVEVRNHINGATVNMGLQHERFPILLRAASARDHKGFRLNIWLTGPTGSGKTSAAEAVARALGLDFGSDGSLDADYKVLGFRDANGNVISTEFIRIYKNGGIYIADEIDNWMPSALLSLNAALANGWMTTPSGIIQRHADACIIACANTWGLGATGDYVGRTRLDAASLDRFQPKIDWPYDEKLEQAVAIGMSPQYGNDWFDIVRNARAKAKTQGLKIIISPRATYNGLSLLAAGFTPNEVIDMTLAAGISAEQKKAIGLDKSFAQSTTVAVRTYGIEDNRMPIAARGYSGIPETASWNT